MNVGDTARIARGPWTGFTGRVTALFNGFTAVQLAGFERTFANDELDDAGSHRAVASDGGSRWACIDSVATSRNRAPEGTCEGA